MKLSLIAGALFCGLAPAIVHAQDPLGSTRNGPIREGSQTAATIFDLYGSDLYGSMYLHPTPFGSPAAAPHSNAYAPGPAPTRSILRGAGPAQEVSDDEQSDADRPRRLAAASLFGLSAENGRVQWPLGLRLLPPGEPTAVRDQLEVVLFLVATQSTDGAVNPTFIQLGVEAASDLRQWLRRRQWVMPENTYAEATRFLNRAERGLILIRASETRYRASR
jgi:hypothetical protein